MPGRLDAAGDEVVESGLRDLGEPADLDEGEVPGGQELIEQRPAAAEPLRRLADIEQHARAPLLLSPFVLAELDHPLSTRAAQAAELALLDEVARGAYRLEPFRPGDVATAREVIAQCGDLDIGLTDASIVVLAQRHDALDVLTLDRRHFEALRGPGGRQFQLPP